MEEVQRIILAVPDDRGKGLFWWEPAAPKRGFSTRTYFDKDGNVMPVIKVFDKYTRK
jgi:arabinogalactan endo-1,4-beta-galactosidase